MESYKDLTPEQKRELLYSKVYERINYSSTGRKIIGTHYLKLSAKIIGGNYESLTDIQKKIFKSDVLDECVNYYTGISHYTRH
jgi:hypothetical protein